MTSVSENSEFFSSEYCVAISNNYMCRVIFYYVMSLRSKLPDPVPRETEGKPFSSPPTDPLHPHTVQPRTKVGGHDAMSMHPQARSQSERPDPSGASRTGGAPLRKFTGTSLPNGKVSDGY